MSEFTFGEMPSFNVEPVESVTVDNITVDRTSAGYVTAKRLWQKQQELAEITEKNNAKISEQAQIKAEMKRVRDEMQAKLDVLAQANHKIEEELFDVRRKIRDLKVEIDSIKRLLMQALENEKFAEELKHNALIFDKRTADFFYRKDILKHQMDGAFILATNMRCILGDKRGAGKTLTSIAAWDMNQSQKVLVIVPDDVVGNFAKEIAYWAPHRTTFVVGKMPKLQRDFALEVAKHMDSFTVVVNYSAWRKDKDLIPKLIDLRFDTCVLDEAHTVKNCSTAAYKGVRQLVLAENCCPACGGAVEHRPISSWTSADFCVNGDWNSKDESEWDFLDRCSIKMMVPMTGTVILNKPQDLYALLSLIDPVLFDSEISYLRAYCQQNYYNGKWEFRSGGLDSLRKKLSGKYIAREGVKTPKQSITVHDIDMDTALYPAQARVIEQLSKHAQILLESGKKMNILYTIALITRKRQANVWPAGIQLKDEEGNVVFSVGDEVQESIKLDEILKYDVQSGEWDGLLPDLTENGDMELGSRVVVFSQFKGPLKELERRCVEANIAVARYDGDTPQWKRDEIEIDFDRKYCDVPDYDKKYQVLLANYRTGGVGLNFTGATETIIIDEEWNPGKADQAYGRTDRIGQTQETNVHILRLNHTIDDWMVSLNEHKANMIAGFNDATEDLSQQLLNAMKSGEVM